MQNRLDRYVRFWWGRESAMENMELYETHAEMQERAIELKTLIPNVRMGCREPLPREGWEA